MDLNKLLVPTPPDVLDSAGLADYRSKGLLAAGSAHLEMLLKMAGKNFVRLHFHWVLNIGIKISLLFALAISTRILKKVTANILHLELA